eukprot:TRINITY_DN211_c0_g2_i3.p1 TRINITY_DN211_c0_g2~~TRINITY_DN211_c0_g2_i3.p1  ORF type:complete len:246 (-),score=70.95 TRINITY_DN211_c0_g2_i3:144-782(-)
MEQKAITYVPMTLASRTEGADQIYALPYIDSELDDPALKKTMQQLLKNEIRAMRAENSGKRKNYLAELEIPSLPIIDSAFIQSEIERVSSTGVQKLNLTAYENTVDPPAQMDDLAAWDRSIDRSKINYEHALNTEMNMELLKEMGAAKYKKYVEMLRDELAVLEREYEQMVESVTEVNRSRKFVQVHFLLIIAKAQRNYYRSFKCENRGTAE